MDVKHRRCSGPCEDADVGDDGGIRTTKGANEEEGDQREGDAEAARRKRGSGARVDAPGASASLAEAGARRSCNRQPTFGTLHTQNCCAA